MSITPSRDFTVTIEKLNLRLGGLGSPQDAINGVLVGDTVPFRLEDFAGVATWAGKPIYNHEQVIGQIDAGPKVGGGNNTITFSFLDGPTTIGVYNNPNYGFPEPGGYSPF